MKRIAFTLAAMVVGAALYAQAPIRLYDGKAPGSESWTQQEATIEYMSPFWNEINTVVLNVVDPVIIPYLPAPGTETGAAMLVCPGGGFTALSWNNEGPQVAEWLAAHGIAAFVLKYRIGYAGGTPEEVQMSCDYTYGGKQADDSYRALKAKLDKVNEKIGDTRPLAVADAKQAIKYIRNNASKFGVDSDRIGMVGFSAGAILTLDVLADHDPSCKPNVAGSIYAPNIMEAAFPSDPCPLFVAATQFEISGLAYSLYDLWCKNRLPAEIHSFTDSRHGFGYRSNGAAENLWITQFYNFLEKVHFLQ